MKFVVSLVAALFAAPLGADDVVESVGSETTDAFVATANAACLSLAVGSSSLSSVSAEEDQKVIESFGLTYGVNREIYDRFGVQGSGILNRAVMGNRKAGADAIVLAVGGALPGCKVVLLSEDQEGLPDRIDASLATADPAWRELPFADSRPGSSVTKKSYFLRGEAGDPFILNLIMPTVPDSDIRLLATINRIPPDVEIPEGY
ncbi:MAG: hypothetical protein AAF250_02875 [Pseudomonadota bacterium]